MQPQWFDTGLQDDLKKIGTRIESVAGTTIIREDLDNEHAYIILQGKVRVWALCDPFVDDSIHTVLLDDIEALDIIGEISGIDGKPSAASVEAVTDTHLLRFSSSYVIELMDQHPLFKNHILWRLCNNLRTANEKIRDMRILSANARIAREILRMIGDKGRGHEAGTVHNFPTHEVLAARCGVRRETVSRTVGSLIKEGLLKRDGKNMIIVNMRDLATAYDTARGSAL